jgi:surface protein
MTTYTGSMKFVSSTKYTSVSDLRNKIIIDNSSDSSFTGTISSNTSDGTTFNHIFNFTYIDKNNNNGFSLTNFFGGSGDTSITKINFDGIPLSRAGSQFKNFTGTILSVSGNAPTILSDTKLEYAFQNSTISGTNYIGNWNTSTVINMKYMFAGANNFNEDISGWNVTNVTNMRNMFDGATSFNQDISGWNVTNVTNMRNMFDGATSFNQHIELWSVQNTDNLDYMFLNATEMTNEYNGIDSYGDTPLYTFFNQSSPFCLLAGSLVKTDQGLIKIEELKEGYSIDGNKIIGISKEFYKRKYLILIEKDLIGHNVPSQDTYITGSHHIMYNNELITCNNIMKKYKDCGFKIIKYDKEPIVYNVICESYCNMICNNIVMETLEHCHKNKTYKLIYF